MGKTHRTDKEEQPYNKQMYKRAEYNTIKERLEEPRRFIQVVMGPRQVGKSTSLHCSNRRSSFVRRILARLSH